MASKTGEGIVAALFAAVLLYNCSADSDEDVQFVASELGVSDEEASDLLAEYSSPEDAIDDYRDEHGSPGGSYDSYSPYGTYSSGYGRTSSAEPERAPFDEYAATRAAEDELALQGYDYSYGCTIDCSGHEAGWQWRAEHGYSTPGHSNSFDEGGRAFDEAVDARVQEMRNAYEAGDAVDY